MGAILCGWDGICLIELVRFTKWLGLGSLVKTSSKRAFAVRVSEVMVRDCVSGLLVTANSSSFFGKWLMLDSALLPRGALLGLVPD